MNSTLLKTSKDLTLAAAVLGLSTVSASAQGAGASVDWEIVEGETATVFYDAPINFDKHYRICFQDVPTDGSLTVVLADRELQIMKERCVDVVSHQISVKLLGTDGPVSGIFYLVE